MKRRAPRMYQLLERKGMSEQHTARATERSRVEALQKGRVDANDIDPSGHVPLTHAVLGAGSGFFTRFSAETGITQSDH